MTKNLIIEAMLGLGDNVYHRGLVRALATKHNVYVRTPWPQLYHDLQAAGLCRLLDPATTLRTQQRNMASVPNHVWADNPSDFLRLHVRYEPRDFIAGRPIPSALFERAKCLNDEDFSFEPKPEWIEAAKRIRPKGPFAIVHPPTVRREWHNVARNPDPKYMQWLVSAHQEFTWWEVIDLHTDEEVRYGQPIKGVVSAPPLSTELLIGLMAVADVIVTAPGFMVPLGIALRTPVLALYGGDLPDRLLVEDWMKGVPYAAVEPKPFCECGVQGNRHTTEQCNKVLDVVEIERAFTRVACGPLLEWNESVGYGSYPVVLDHQYDQGYYDNYARLACTGMGKEITDFRVGITRRHFRGLELVDVGPGACAFVEASGAFGFDVNPATNARLKELGRYVDPDVMPDFEVLTFWDSLEHIPMSNLLDLLKRTRNGCVVSMPIYEDHSAVLRSRHFKPREHMHYWTHKGFVDFMRAQGFHLLETDDTETALGREGVRTYAFSR